MKKIFLILLLMITVSSTADAQQKSVELPGIWKISLKPSGFKKPPPPEYLLMMDDSLYTIGVDSVGNTLPGASSGRWTVITDGMLLLYPSDKIAERRYYRSEGENRFRYIGTTLKKSQPILEMDIYLEKQQNTNK